jgi:hypothetical protein
MKDYGQQLIDTIDDIQSNGDWALNKNGKLALDEFGYHYRVATPKQKKRMARLTKLYGEEIDASRKRLNDICRGIMGKEKFDKLQKKLEDPEYVEKQISNLNKKKGR